MKRKLIDILHLIKYIATFAIGFLSNTVIN